MKFLKWLFVLAFLSAIPFAMANEKYSSLEKYESVVLTFAKGDPTLSAAETTKLRTIIQHALMTGDITRAEVAAWSDLPHQENENLSQPNRDLADMRLQSVKNELSKDVGSTKKISLHNMATTSHWLGRNFHSSEAELDAVFAKKTSDAMERHAFKLIKKDGAPSKAIVVFKVRK
ncbi:MAG: hypothetical protein A2X86_21765 [Bdellovibrionales bacterium GWA2_49_15]|nr:MAG: hypothetical protein A2X86_21765 [Bdellovibrionales bacterium GWA2_49_15]HAZ12843.1 hypothetical protein [Bdellovibrionales bacterium]